MFARYIESATTVIDFAFNTALHLKAISRRRQSSRLQLVSSQIRSFRSTMCCQPILVLTRPLTPRLHN